MKSLGLKYCLLIFLLSTLAITSIGCSGDSASSATAAPAAGTTTFTVVNNGISSYLINSSANASLSLQRGQTYTFNLSATGHPFYIMSAQGTNTANAYTSGVSGNGTQSGTLIFVVPAGAPNTLYYNCSIHSGMTGVISITN